MRRLALLTAICGLLPSVGAQEVERARLEAVLERVAFDGHETAPKLGSALASLSASDLAALCDMLVEPGAGDDTKARMALHGLALYVGGDGSAAPRGTFVRALCSALEADRAPAVKVFLIRQLELAGDKQAVPTLTRFLADEELCHPSAHALLAIGGEEATKALRDALEGASGRARIAIINALGVLQDDMAAPLISGDSEPDNQDEELRFAALWALRNMGVRPSEQIDPLDRELRHPCYRRSQSLAWGFRCAERQAESGATSAAEGFFDALADLAVTPSNVHWHCAALHTLAHIQGSRAVGKIVESLASENPELRAAAMQIGATLSGDSVTAGLVSALEQAAPHARAAILKVLERRGDAAAFSAARRALDDPDKDVRLAAVSAVATLDEDRAAGQLVALLYARSDGEEREAIQQALARLAGADTSEYVGLQMEGAPALVRVALIEVLTDRRARDQLHRLYTQAVFADEAVRLAAIHAIELLADESAAPKLLTLLSRAERGAEREAVEQALAATCNRAADPAARAVPILAALQTEDVDNYASLLRVLGRIGGEVALNAVHTALEDQRDQIREVAFRALLDWPDPGAANAVLRIARETEDLKYHVLAMRAYARLVSLDENRTAKHRLALYDAGMQATRRPEEQRLLLSNMGEIHDARTLDILELHLSEAALRGEAASAMVSVADGLLPGGWAAARTALERVLSVTEEEHVRQRAEEVMQRVAECEDFVTDWLVAGPYMQADTRGDELLDIVFPPEQPGAPDTTWHKPPVGDDTDRYWYVDLHGDGAVAGADRAAYLFTRLHSPKTQDVWLEIGSDDGVKVWLNRELVHSNNALRSCSRGADVVHARLIQGENDLLLKVTNNYGGWGACLRVRAPEGGHLEGVSAEAQREP